MPPRQGIDPILGQLKSDVLAERREVLEFILFGSAAQDECPRDIDIALIVPDHTNIFKFARAISEIAAAHTAELGILISCFPIQAKRYSSSSSQYLSNIHAHGRKF